jgi:hypothetical protein
MFIYSTKDNIGNRITNCNEKILENSVNNGEVILTKLRNYISYFENKNLAMIKMDIEGLEGKAIENGIEFITNYHFPFIFMDLVQNILVDMKQILKNSLKSLQIMDKLKSIIFSKKLIMI